MSIEVIEKPNWKSSSSGNSKKTNKVNQPSIGNDGIDKIVLNVEMYGNKNNRVVRFDFIEIENNGCRYASQEYTLSPKSETLAIFQLLDDFFIRRFKFFHSSRSCQAFMLGLAKSEKMFYDKSGFSFHDFCKEISSKTLEYATSGNAMDLGESFHLHNGYSISYECKRFHDIKQKLVKKEYFTEIGENLFRIFNEQMKFAETNSYCGFMINHTDKTEPVIFCDPVVHLPILTFIPEFTELLSEKLALMFLNAPSYKRANIKEVKIDYFAIMPDATIKDILSLTDKDGTIKNYEKLTNDYYDFIIGKVKELTFKSDDYRDKLLDSIIGYS